LFLGQNKKEKYNHKMNKNNTNIQKSVIKTLAYYRALSTPLNLVQIGRYMVGTNHEPAGIELSDIQNVLDELISRGIVAEQKGLYWLSPRDTEDNIWLKYIRREKIAQRKINKVRKALRLLSLTPFLRGLFICGSVARKISRPGSDIDFLILTKPGHVWTVRFLLTLFALLLGKKTNDTKLFGGSDYSQEHSRRNKFCLNHYRSSANLQLEESLRDLYSAQEYAGMLNVYSGNRTDRKFFKKNKLWLKKFLPNFNFSKLPITENGDYPLAWLRRALEKMLGGKIGHIIEGLLYRIQAKKISLSGGLQTTQRVVAEKEVIMFHLNPRSPLTLACYQQIIKNYG
jgi:predicted nucleotidyltransferase